MGISANELRIGNWYVNYANEERQWELEDFELCSTVCDIDELIKSFIPLTPEWLKRFGLRCPNGDIWYFNKMDQFWFQDLTGLNPGLNYCMGFNEQFAGVSIEFVHQLQNLYFALTGEELELKEVHHSPKES